MSHAKVSVIVPCFNYGRFLAECLASIQSQTYKDFECIVVDNASTDDTKQVAEEFCKSDARFKYFFSAEKGVSLARNLGVSQSSGAFILPVDADDKIATTYMEIAVKALIADPKLTVVYCNAELFGATSGKWTLPKFTLKNLLIENSIFCSAMYRKADFERIGGYNIAMQEGFEDWDFWIRMLKDGGEVFKIPETLFYYRIRENSRNNVLDNEKQLRLRKMIYENHKGIYDKVFTVPELIFENYLLHKKNDLLCNSAEYKAGTAFLKPLRFIKTLFKR